MFKKILIVAFLSFSFSHSQPNSKDYVRIAAELTSFTYTQFFYHPQPNTSNLTSPNKFDSNIRNILHWNSPNNVYAKNFSDLLLYGVFVGGIPLTSFYMKNYNLFLINLEILSINGLVTNVVKYTTNRQRPYSFYNTNNSDNESYKSFFSGHTSTAFALGISTAKMLTKHTDIDHKSIWIGTLGLATATGYFRIAADKHYFTDVLTGAIVGSLIGNLCFDWLDKKYKIEKDAGKLSTSITYTPNKINFFIRM